MQQSQHLKLFANVFQYGDHAVLIGLPPHRQNIKYTVRSLLSKISEFSVEVRTEIQHLTTLSYPKTIVFCQTYRTCAELYHSLKQTLGRFFTYPPSYPDFPQFRIFEMFTKASTVEMKEKVLQSFCSRRIVLATSAFGMGIDCPDIRRIVHWGPSNTLEQYVQESGRAGRDSYSSEATIFNGGLTRHVEDDMRNYVINSTICRREILFKHFLFSTNEHLACGCDCCDVCANAKNEII